MTKAELIDSIASKVDLPKGTADRIVSLIFDDIVAALKGGDKVHISGFGTFQVSIAKRGRVAIPRPAKRSRSRPRARRSSSRARYSRTA
jgi:nucleoid DNA-binding protein